MTERIQLTLYVAGTSPKSQRARANIARIICDLLGNEADLEVVDLLERPELAKADRIVAIPSLVRNSPAPRTTIVGDLSDSAKVLAGLGAIAAIRPGV